MNRNGGGGGVAIERKGYFQFSIFNFEIYIMAKYKKTIVRDIEKG